MKKLTLLALIVTLSSIAPAFAEGGGHGSTGHDSSGGTDHNGGGGHGSTGKFGAEGNLGGGVGRFVVAGHGSNGRAYEHSYVSSEASSSGHGTNG